MNNEEQHFGTWTRDAVDLPCFDLKIAGEDAIDAPFRHLISTGHLSAMADRWGNVNLFTTEGGFLWFNSPYNCLSRSSIYLMLETDGELVSLLFSELNEQEKIRVGTGYIRYAGGLRHRGIDLGVQEEFYTAPDRSRILRGHFTLTNRSGKPFQARLSIRSDVMPPGINCKLGEKWPMVAGPGVASIPRLIPQLGNIFLTAGTEWKAEVIGMALALQREVTLQPGASITFDGAVGYGDGADAVPSLTLPEAQKQWQQILDPFQVEAPEPWMEAECLWNAGQLLSFSSYDSVTKEYYIALGGYGWEKFSVREVSETSMILARTNWFLAASSLRFVAKTQLSSGDVPKLYNMRKDRTSEEYDSDNELWFVLGCAECVAATGNFGFLDEVCSFWDGGEGTVWEHLKKAFYWVRDEIGRGSHGLILMREGDWNDYLSLMGAKGQGESVMNSGMACRAFDTLSKLADRRGDKFFAQELEIYIGGMRRAVTAAFDTAWFRRGYADSGLPIGSYEEDRLFINAQSWTALGKCGTPEQRKQALLSAVEKCHTDIGLMLMSRPYSSPAPDYISWCAIPAGEGENAGIWPQTVYWMVWALAEEGLLDEALDEWKCGTLRNHAHRFPGVPFGIFNGPDCFSSKWAGRREGRTQRQLLDRAHFAPMNPMIAWQGFAMQKINEARKRHG